MLETAAASRLHDRACHRMFRAALYGSSECDDLVASCARGFRVDLFIRVIAATCQYGRHVGSPNSEGSRLVECDRADFCQAVELLAASHKNAETRETSQ